MTNEPTIYGLTRAQLESQLASAIERKCWWAEDSIRADLRSLDEITKEQTNVTDTNKNAMNDAIKAAGEQWMQKVEDLSKTSWSQLIACLGANERILELLDLQFDPAKNIALRDVMVAHEKAGTLEQFQAALMHHVGEVVMFAHEKISAEIDRRFSLVKIN